MRVKYVLRDICTVTDDFFGDILAQVPRTDHDHPLDTLDRQSAFTFQTDTYDSEWYLHRSSTYVLESASAAATTHDAVSDSEFRDDLNLAVPGETDITVDENRIIVTGAFPPNRLWAVSNGSV